jgi:hypothetical protein
MSETAPHPERGTPTRDALDRLAGVSVAELRQLALTLDFETKIVKSLLRERTRRPERAAGLSVLAEEDCTA